MPRKKSNNTKKLIAVAIGIALIGSIMALIYRSPGTEPELPDAGTLATCGDGIANSTNYVQEFIVPSECSGPHGIAVDSDGFVWFAESANRKITKFDPDTKQFKEYAIPESDRRFTIALASIWDMRFDDNGNLWFTDFMADAIWKFDPESENFEKFAIPVKRSQDGTVRGSGPINLAFDKDGNIWFSQIFSKNIGFLSTNEHDNDAGMKEFSVAVDLQAIGPLAVDDADNIWFTALTYPISGKLMKLDPVNDRFSVHEVPAEIISPIGIVTDKEGNLWINDHGTSAFVKFNPNTNSATKYVTSLPHPSTSWGGYEACLTQPEGSPITCGGAALSLPYWNDVDEEGRIWANLHQGNSIMLFDPKTETQIEYFIPTQNSQLGDCDGYDEPCGFSNALQFALAPDGRVWFTELTENKIGVLNPNLPLPIKLEIANRDVRVAHGESVDIDLHVIANETLESEVNMRISGTIVPTGKLSNMTASFSDTKLSFNEPSTKPMTLTLAPMDGLKPGEYRITVSANYRDVTYSEVLRLIVEPRKI